MYTIPFIAIAVLFFAASRERNRRLRRVFTLTFFVNVAFGMHLAVPDVPDVTDVTVEVPPVTESMEVPAPQLNADWYNGNLRFAITQILKERSNGSNN